MHIHVYVYTACKYINNVYACDTICVCVCSVHVRTVCPDAVGRHATTAQQLWQPWGIAVLPASFYSTGTGRAGAVGSVPSPSVEHPVSVKIVLAHSIIDSSQSKCASVPHANHCEPASLLRHVSWHPCCRVCDARVWHLLEDLVAVVGGCASAFLPVCHTYICPL